MGDRSRMEVKFRGVRRFTGGLIAGVRLAIPMMTQSITFLLIIAWTGYASPALAGRPVYRCTQNGQTILGDTPCQDTAAAASGAGSQSSTVIVGSPSMMGAWRAEAQFQGAERGQPLEGAHFVVPLALTFSEDGKVSGKSTDNGCQLLGLWTAGATPRLFMLDITLNSCRHAELNRRYSGTVTIRLVDESAQLLLLADTVPTPGQTLRRYHVEATLRR
jgi:hypothetical protein